MLHLESLITLSFQTGKASRHCKDSSILIFNRYAQIGLWMDQLIKKEGYDVKFLPSNKFHNYACEADSITAHYQSPEKMICMWNKWKSMNGKQYNPIHQFRRILLDKFKLLSSRCC